MSRSRPVRGRADARGEVLPVAILFLGVIFTILIGVHVMMVAIARTAVQAAADAADGTAQVAAPDDRADEDVPGARIALAAARSSVVETRLPAVAAEPERGQVQVLVFAGIISPVFGGSGTQRPGLRPPRRHRHIGPHQRPRPGNAEIPAAACLPLLCFGLLLPAGARAAAARAARAPRSGRRRCSRVLIPVIVLI